MEHKTADVSTLSIKQLKALIGAAGLSTAGCVEKSDLRAKATEAQQRLASVPSTPQTPGSQTLGGYECLVKGDTKNVKPVLQALEGSWNKGLGGWVFPMKKREEVLATLRQDPTNIINEDPALVALQDAFFVLRRGVDRAISTLSEQAALAATYRDSKRRLLRALTGAPPADAAASAFLGS